MLRMFKKIDSQVLFVGLPVCSSSFSVCAPAQVYYVDSEGNPAVQFSGAI
jgi:hypothetical protein